MGQALTKEKEQIRRNKISETAKKNKKSGGLRHGSGRGKKGWYGGYFCDSSWELAWVIYHLDHNIYFERNKIGFDYVFNNQNHKFYPDFIKDGIYYEIKGWPTLQNNAKYEQFNGFLIVLDKHGMKDIIKYVVNKYGPNFIGLYEDKNYIKRCSMCGKDIYSHTKTGLCRDCYIKSPNKIRNHRVIIKKPKPHCNNCGVEIEKNKTGLCKTCYHQPLKFDISKSKLEQLIQQYPYVQISKMFNVSDKTIKNRANKLGIILGHKRGYWAKQYGELLQVNKLKNAKYCRDCGVILGSRNKSGYCQKCSFKHNFKITGG